MRFAYREQVVAKIDAGIFFTFVRIVKPPFGLFDDIAVSAAGPGPDQVQCLVTQRSATKDPPNVFLFCL